MLVASKYSRRTEKERKKEERGIRRCFDWSILPAKTTQPIADTAPRNCRVSRFTKTGEGFPFRNSPPELTSSPRPCFLFIGAGRLIFVPRTILEVCVDRSVVLWKFGQVPCSTKLSFLSSSISRSQWNDFLFSVDIRIDLNFAFA